MNPVCQTGQRDAGMTTHRRARCGRSSVVTWGKVGAASAVLAGAALSGAWAPGAGMRDVEAAANSFVVCAGRVITSSWRGEWDIADGIIVVRDGRIEAVGSADDVDVPLGLPVYHYPDATVMPGMVAACSNVVGQRSGDESIGAGYSALDAFQRVRRLSRDPCRRRDDGAH